MIISATPEQFSIIACRAIEWHRLKNEAAEVKRAYHLAWRRHELCGEDPEEFESTAYRITRKDFDLWDAALIATASEFAAYKAASKKVSNAKRRLETAIRAIS